MFYPDGEAAGDEAQDLVKEALKSATSKEEESELFPKKREAFGEERLQQLGEALAQAKQRHQLDCKSKQELYEQAREQGVQGRSRMTKDELAEAIEPS
ncbi:MAG: Rho termination factor N-terminal domain-containing protein [Egibacteraceae bacterium]